MLNQQTEILDHLNKIGEAFPDSTQPLLGSDTETEEGSGDDESEEASNSYNNKTASRRQRKISANLIERQRYKFYIH